MGYEYKLDIAGTTYGMHDIESVSIEHPLFEKPSIGNTCTAKLTMSIWPLGNIPRMAQIIPYCRETEAGDAWTQLGVFFISTRRVNGSKLSIVAYDGMLKASNIWEPSQDLEFPMTMRRASEIIAQTMGTSLDPRCKFNDTYMVDSYPVNLAMRDVLGYIAVAHAGNWIMTAKEQLLLIPLYGSMPEETFYLVTENGAPIQFGEVAIHV